MSTPSLNGPKKMAQKPAIGTEPRPSPSAEAPQRLEQEANGEFAAGKFIEMEDIQLLDIHVDPCMCA